MWVMPESFPRNSPQLMSRVQLPLPLDSGWSNGIPTSRVFLPKSSVDSMNTSHRPSHVIYAARPKVREPPTTTVWSNFMTQTRSYQNNTSLCVSEWPVQANSLSVDAYSCLGWCGELGRRAPIYISISISPHNKRRRKQTLTYSHEPSSLYLLSQVIYSLFVLQLVSQRIS